MPECESRRQLGACCGSSVLQACHLSLGALISVGSGKHPQPLAREEDIAASGVVAATSAATATCSS